jgi:Putative Actinobacterial Holin-X, holin superfamily III
VHEPSLPEAMTSADLVKELTDNASLLLQRQLAMAKLEAEQELHKRKTLYELLGAASLLAYGGGLFLLMAAACAVGELAFGHVWMGMLPVAVLLFGFALVPYFLSRQKRLVAPPFERTRRELRKELSWAKYRTT